MRTAAVAGAVCALIAGMAGPALAADAQHIEINTGVGPVQLGMTQDQVTAAIGQPDSAYDRYGQHFLRYTTLRMDVGLQESPSLFKGVRVVTIKTTSPDARTTSGAGPGASRHTLKGNLGGQELTCFKGHSTTTLKHATGCYVDAGGFGSYGTSFALRGKRITNVQVYRVTSDE